MRLLDAGRHKTRSWAHEIRGTRVQEISEQWSRPVRYTSCVKLYEPGRFQKRAPGKVRAEQMASPKVEKAVAVRLAKVGV